MIRGIRWTKRSTIQFLTVHSGCFEVAKIDIKLGRNIERHKAQIVKYCNSVEITHERFNLFF